MSVNKQAVAPDVWDSITAVEEVSCLLNSYTELLFKANHFLPNDPADCLRANAQIYALLTAVRTQLDRLKSIPDALMQVRTETGKTAPPV